MDYQQLIYRRNLLLLGLRRWDDLLPAKEREAHPERARLLEQIRYYDELIRMKEKEAEDMSEAA